MTEQSAIQALNVSKSFRLPNEKNTSIKGAVIGFWHRKRGYEKQQVLDEISFEIKKGEFFGIVGRNGSGKSTLLKLLAGIYTPNSGSIEVNGKLTPFIELGVGFNPELTGRENVFLNGALMGFNRAEMEAMYDEIVAFAELERFMEQKLKNYSSGMQVRLAFSIAIKSQSEILVFDEVLAVGDANFQAKCYDVFKRIKEEKRTVVLVTHDMSAVREYCDRALLLDKGSILSEGSPIKVTDRYNELNLQAIDNNTAKKLSTQRSAHKTVEIRNIWLEAKGKNTHTLSPDDPLVFMVECHASDEVVDPVFGITLKDQAGKPIFATNTKAKHIKTGKIKAGQTIGVRFEIDNIYSDGNYYLVPAVTDASTTRRYDSIEEGYRFTISGWDYPAFVTQPKNTIKISMQKKERNNQ
jgi:ABC-2 type transport system ATP-binding protein